ncbi:hypothetical protein K438DRAFT_1961882 [Mycena galopus ATCC 62051]|nr:hypothetical protein K438DRAFT_1961882 [Mycena galopus ATCC 62051]
MILDEKVLTSPPPTPRPLASSWRRIVYAAFSEAYDIEDAKEQRKTLSWLAVGLRLVNRVFYTTSMNVLQSIHLPLYDSLIRPLYTSDPFPFARLTFALIRAEIPLSREMDILDLFIALKLREDVTNDSDLHLSSAEPAFTGLLSLCMAPARLEDLVRT